MLTEKDKATLRKVRQDTDYWMARKKRREVSERQKALEEF